MKTIRSCDILVPDNCDHKKWSVVACDQFTSERGHWKKLEDFPKKELERFVPEMFVLEDDNIVINIIK